MNKKRDLLLVIALHCFALGLYAQVGINTQDPQTMLDVVGTLQVRKDLRLGGTNGTASSSGNKGVSIVKSAGPGNSAYWGDPTVVTSNFGITESIALSDRVGVVYTNPMKIAQLTELTEFSKMTDDPAWIAIPGLNCQVTPKHPTNRVVVSLQSMLQTGAFSQRPDVVVALGVFVDNELRSTRSFQLRISDMGFLVIDVFDTFTNLPVKSPVAAYQITIAAKLRYLAYPLDSSEPTGRYKYIAVGTNDGFASNTNPFMNQSSLKIDLYEDLNSK